MLGIGLLDHKLWTRVFETPGSIVFTQLAILVRT